ncbi:unnamed protein product [Hymenolepis diminuta]|uniref:Uncharacterized protein n=1 Tax=Hymenolepis diminuta TaxID=6216 RepID=A0A564Y965_HYMDI|nr:unnamed protein product [Hymenolepis diminuta]
MNDTQYLSGPTNSINSVTLKVCRTWRQFSARTSLCPTPALASLNLRASIM